jgi:predicted nucleotidyltransferase
MRLGANEAKAVGEEVRRLDPAAEIYLYGSRANDSAKGGDIDLLASVWPAMPVGFCLSEPIVQTACRF